ncbi:MAG: thioredoxin domain-containing protein [Undibacterium sp.]|nr:thioredoxin domain-containing protein [Opitutaceae bacterium]
MSNALASEKSPYLRQHAENPVDWLPWGEVAFAKARAEEKPIFLSIGYATCHWCHVMAHESFEDPAVAEILNEHFVSIKVDREERPDVDKVYMAYVQALTGHGGWPLSAWLTPELKPFFGGTYFPPQDRPGRAGFSSLLRAIERGWREERAKLVNESERIIGELRTRAEGRGAGGEGRDVEGGDLAEAAGAAFEGGFQYFHEAFDAENGGFGGAPKFPRASNLAFLFRCAAQQGLESELGRAAVDMAGHTLRKMARGGIHDHVGGGFHRYSVDEAWFVPHFEKMLYDQAQIAMNALEMRQAGGDERYAWMARDIFDYVAEQLTGAHGGFLSAEDADSTVPGAPEGEHAEGAFYVWTHGEIAAVLGGDADFFSAHFGVKVEGNVPVQLDPQGEFPGKNILAQVRPLAESARVAGLTTEEASERLRGALAKLKTVRAARPRPLLDDKVITAWNGLMISALARGAQVLGGGGEKEEGKEERERLLRAAVRAAEFVERELHDAGRGVLFRSWREGRGASEGFAEDYAFFIQGLIDLYEASFEIRWLQWAGRLQVKMDELFWDGADGGYFNSAAGAADIVLRLKDDYDGAEPTPSSVAAMNLLRLAAMLGDEPSGSAARLGHRARAIRTLEALRAQWTRVPQGLPQMLCALELAFLPPRHVVLAGDPEAEDFLGLAAVLHERLGPRRAVLAADGGEGQRWLAKRAPWLAEMRPVGGRATAFVCEEFTCRAPVTAAAELRGLLAKT